MEQAHCDAVPLIELHIHLDDRATLAALQRIEKTMSDQTAADAALSADIAAENSKIDDAIAAIAGFPAAVSAAVADALAAANVDAAATLAATQAADAAVKAETDKLTAALTTPPAP